VLGLNLGQDSDYNDRELANDRFFQNLKVIIPLSSYRLTL
jgi:hypothetical protein